MWCGLCVCVLDTLVAPAKIAELVEMPFEHVDLGVHACDRYTHALFARGHHVMRPVATSTVSTF